MPSGERDGGKRSSSQMSPTPFSESKDTAPFSQGVRAPRHRRTNAAFHTHRAIDYELTLLCGGLCSCTIGVFGIHRPKAR